MTTGVSEGIASARKDASTDCVFGKKRLFFSTVNTENANPIPAMVAKPSQAHFQPFFLWRGLDTAGFFGSGETVIGDVDCTKSSCINGFSGVSSSTGVSVFFGFVEGASCDLDRVFNNKASLVCAMSLAGLTRRHCFSNDVCSRSDSAIKASRYQARSSWALAFRKFLKSTRVSSVLFCFASERAFFNV